MSSKRAQRLRNVLLTVVTAGALGVSSCQEGGQGVSTKQACSNGAQFDCSSPSHANT